MLLLRLGQHISVSLRRRALLPGRYGHRRSGESQVLLAFSGERHLFDAMRELASIGPQITCLIA